MLFRLNQLQNKLWLITGESIIDITPSQKEFDFKFFQESLIKNLDKLDDSIAAIYVQKNIEIIQETEDSQNVVIESIKRLEWNGIIITNDGYILTNKHVVQDQKAKYTVVIGKDEFDLEKVWYDNWLDIAVIKIKVKDALKPAKIIKINDKTKIWQIVFALKKDPDIMETIVKMGIINSKNQRFKIENNSVYVWLIKTNTAIEPWFSGWPLIDLNWEVIWINTAIDNIEYGASYSLPISQEFINQTIASIKESGKIIRPYLWIKYENHELGIKVTSIENWSSSKIEWLEVNDIIYGINNEDINYNNFLYLLYTYKINRKVVLNVQRWNHKQDIHITLWIKD